MNWRSKPGRIVVALVLSVLLSVSFSLEALAYTESTVTSGSGTGNLFVYEAEKKCAQIFSVPSAEFLYSAHVWIAYYTSESTVTATIQNAVKNSYNEYIPGGTVLATADNTATLVSTGTYGELVEYTFYFTGSPVFLDNDARYALCFTTTGGAMYGSSTEDTYSGGNMCTYFSPESPWSPTLGSDLTFRICSADAENDSEASAYVEKLIASLPAAADITLDDSDLVEAVRAQYDALPNPGLVGDISRLTDAETAIETLVNAVAYDVVDLIDALPAAENITLGDTDAVTAARAAYEALTAAQQGLVTNIDKLVADESAIAAINQAAADAVISMINALPSPADLSYEDLDAVTEAYTAYQTLPDAQKSLVTNYDTLSDAMSTVMGLIYSPQHVIDLIDGLPDVITLSDRGRIVNARYWYEMCLSSDDQLLVTNLGDLESAEAALAALEAPYLTAGNEAFNNVELAGGGWLVAQTFTAGKSGVLNSVSVPVAVGNGGTTTLRASICALTPDGLPGDVLAQSGEVLLEYEIAAQDARFDFSGSGLTLTEGAQYALLIETNGMTILMASDENPYSGGYICSGVSGSMTKSEVSDLYFTCLVGGNTAPIAADAELSTNQGATVSIDLSGYISDADGDDLTVAVDSAENGTASLAGTVVTFTPDAGYSGYSASFTYSVTDGNGGTDTATVNITIKVPTSITINGAAVVTVPLRRSGPSKSTYIASVYDQNGSAIDGQAIAWSLAAPVTGVSIDSATGVLTVTDKAAAGGKVTLKAVCGSASGTFDVTLKKYVSVSSVQLNKHSAVLAVGETSALTATILPSDATNKDLTWYSTDTSVVTVDDEGNMTATGTGIAIVAVLSSESGRLDLCIVSVIKERVSVTGVSLNMTTASLRRGGRLLLLATVKPWNATNQGVTWSSSNTSILKVNDYGIVTAVGSGTATITVTTEDGGFSAACTIKVK